MDVYITRHGQTQWNTEFRMQGQFDSPLTESGVNGAIALGGQIAQLPDKIKVCYASPMPRTMRTATLIQENSGYDFPVISEPNLIEMDLGSWEGMRREDAKAKWPDVFYNFRHDPNKFVPIDGGETFADVIARATRMLDELRNGSRGEGPVLLVTHMILIQALLWAYGEGQWAGYTDMRAIGDIAQTTLYKITL